MKLAQGTVVGLIAGYYDVETAAGIVRTRARGVFRQKKQKPAVGDHELRPWLRYNLASNRRR